MIVWLNDIHFDFLDIVQENNFVHDIKKRNPKFLFIAGDIGQSESLEAYLIRIRFTLGIPIYFVLGNHDYYGSSIEEVNKKISKFCKDMRSRDRLFYWLDEEQPVVLNENTVLIGVSNAFGDMSYGNYKTTTVKLNDFEHISELKRLVTREEVINKLKLYSFEWSNLLLSKLMVVEKYQNIIVLLHTPPFKEAAWYKGEQSNDDLLPFFANKSCGQALKVFASNTPKCNITVLCGHTHSGGEVQILPNLKVITGESDYRAPIFHKL